MFYAAGVDLGAESADAINFVVAAFVIVVLTAVAVVSFRKVRETIISFGDVAG